MQQRQSDELERKELPHEKKKKKLLFIILLSQLTLLLILFSISSVLNNPNSVQYLIFTEEFRTLKSDSLQRGCNISGLLSLHHVTSSNKRQQMVHRSCKTELCIKRESWITANKHTTSP